MSKKKIIFGGILFFIFFGVYFDQKFEVENIEELRVVANNKIDTSSIAPLKVFTTDGCSLSVNNFFGIEFTDICIEHDMEYWKGGSAKDRKMADSILRERVNERVPFVGSVMYFVVRVFGHPIIPAPWRWGYGFEYPYRY